MCILAGLVTFFSEQLSKVVDTNLRQRWISSCVLAAIVVGCTYVGGIPFALFVSVASAGCMREFMRLVHVEETLPYKWIGRLSGLAFCAAAFLESSIALLPICSMKPSCPVAPPAGSLSVSHSLQPFYILPVLVIMIILVVPLVLQTYKGMSVRESFTIFGVLYFGWFLAHLVFIRNHADGFGYSMFLCMGVVWSDVLAYAAGRLFGKIKMAPLISPKKTREGAIGGLLGAIASCLLFRYLIPGLTPPLALVMGMVIGVAAILGDLSISVVKRDVGVKDSSCFIPGHGGILDRCGSFTFASPTFYYCMRLFGFLN
jgi:phosphatidate cytidylyltransferase